MRLKKNIILTLWLLSMVLAGLFFLLPSRADDYFLSIRILKHEKMLVEARVAQKKRSLKFFKDPAADVKVLATLDERARRDSTALLVHVGFIVFALNLMGFFLYAFNMPPWRIVAWVCGYALVPVFIVLSSFLRISP